METQKEKTLSILLIIAVIVAFIFFILWQNATDEADYQRLRAEMWEQAALSTLEK